MKKILFILTMMLCSIGVAVAAPVGIDKARKAALNYLKMADPANANLTEKSIVDISSTTPFREFYVFSITPRGFILVSGDDCVRPVLGYSSTSGFDGERLPEPVKDWLEGYERQIRAIRAEHPQSNQVVASQWEQLDDLHVGETYVELNASPATPLLATTWAQTANYNLMCPTENGSRCYPGSIATAMAQVMRYWSWPDYGVGGTHSYSWNGSTLSVDLGDGDNYDWSQMPDALTTSSSQTQQTAIARLSYCCAVAVHTNFSSTGGSTAYLFGGATYNSASYALANYFKYTCQEVSKSSYTDARWKTLMQTEIDNNRPVIYSGSGTASGSHVFVLDGYNDYDQFHFNWGWGGQCDGYYAIGALNPYSSVDFNTNNTALVQIAPNGCYDGNVFANPHYIITPTDTWETHSATTAPSCWKTYYCAIPPYQTYTFSTSPSQGGGNADYDTYLYLYDSTELIAQNDDYNGSYQSLLQYTNTNPYPLDLYLRVAGYGTTNGRYTLAYRTEEVSHSVTVAANTPEGGTVSGGGTFVNGTLCTVHAVCNDGYSFNYWTDEYGNAVSHSLDYSFFMIQDLNLTAHFVPYSQDYWCDFEGPDFDGNEWVLVNEGQTNYWTIDFPSDTTDNINLHITDTQTVGYAHYAIGTRSIAWAYRNQMLRADHYRLEFDWYANGESCCDYLGVFLVPSSSMPEAGAFPNGSTSISSFLNNLPDGWTSLTGTTKLNRSAATQHFSCEFDVVVDNHYRVVFMWANDNSVGSQPPAGVDNIRLHGYTCNVTTSSNLPGTCFTYGGSTYREGENCTVSAWTSEDLPFICWTADGQIVSTDRNYTFTVSSDVDLVAHFSSQRIYYYCGFEGDSSRYEWLLANGDQPNKWHIGTADANMGRNSLYISNDGGSSVAYTNNVGSTVWASCLRTLRAGNYNLSFAWKAIGESCCDRLHVFVAPVGDTLRAGEFPNGALNVASFLSNLPEGWTCLSGNGLGLESIWQAFNSYNIDVPYYGFRLVFLWANDASAGTNPPAIIDEINIEPVIYHISASVNPPGAGTVTGTGDYASSSECELTAVAAEGYSFSHWTNHVSLERYDPVHRFVVWGNQSLTANFLPNDSLFRCTFENPPDSTGWVLVNGEEPNQWHIGPAADTGGARGLYVTSDNGISNTYNNTQQTVVWAYKELSLTAGTYHISYDWRCHGENNYDWLSAFLVPAATTLTAGVTPEGANFSYGYTLPEGWIDLSGGKLNGSRAWQKFNGEVEVSAGDYKLAFLWINDGSAGQNPPAAVDNILFGIKQCPGPANLTVADVTEDSFEITWDEGGTVAPWLLEIETEGNRWSYVTWETSYQAQWLTPNTDYRITLTAMCGNGFAGMPQSLTVRTDCAALNSLPFTMGFETTEVTTSSSNNFINCWHRLGNSATMSISAGTNHTPSGSQSLNCSYNSDSSDRYVVLPRVATDIYPVGTLQLTLWIRTNSELNNPQFEVGVMDDPDDANTFVPVQRIGAISDHAWHEYLLSLEGYEGSGAYVALKIIGDGAYLSYYLDDFTLEVRPDCHRVEDVVVQGITNESATVGWTEMGPATSWTVEYWASEEREPNVESLTTATNPVTLTGLLPNTEYTVRITPVCPGTAATNQIAFQTNCDVLDSLPYTMNFENTYSEVPECWRRLNNATLYESPEVIWTSNRTADGHRALFWNYTYNGGAAYGNYQVVVLPGVDVDAYPVGTLQLSFWARLQSGYGSGFQVGVMTDPHDTNTFTAIQTVATDCAMWKKYVVSFENYTAGSAYIALRAINAWQSWSVYLDDFELKVAPVCRRVEEVAVRNVTHNSARVAWTEMGPATGWRVIYHAEGQDYALTRTVSVPYVDLSALLADAEYTVWIVPEQPCAGSADTNMIAFHTHCTPLATLPYTMDFEDAETGSSTDSRFVECWNRVNNAIHYYGFPYVTQTSYSNNAITPAGRKCLMWTATVSPTYGDYQIAVLPGVDVSTHPVGTLQLTFWLRSSSTYYYPSFTVGVMTDPYDASTFTAIERIDHGNSTDWNEYLVSLEGYSGSGAYVALRANVAPNNNWSCYLDDFTLEAIPACAKPRDVTIRDIAATSATVAWTPSKLTQNNFVVAYGTGDDPDNMAMRTASGRSVTLSGLAEATHYNVFVKAVCGAGLESEWSRVSSFTTLTTPYIITQRNPFNDNFEGSSKWALINGQVNNWTIGNAIHNGGSKSLYISNDGGLTNSYNNQILQWSYAIKGFAFPAGSVNFSFDWRANGENNYDYLRVFLVPTDKTFYPNVSANGNSFIDFATVTPEGWIALDGGSSLRGDENWSTVNNTVVFESNSVYNMVFIWCNDASSGSQPPAAVDNVSISTACGPLSVADLPYTDNFDNYTTSTTAKTGVEPSCWTLAHQYVTMTNEYKPMVYYSSANAHSGNYSLILNKRGIYAMPEFSGDVSKLKLDFYLKQSAAKYQLQVGVMSSLDNASSFVPVATFNNSSTTASVPCTVDFSSYTGTGHYIAFKNILASGQTGDYSCNYIDDLELSLAAPTCPAITSADLPYTDNFDGYTTSTTAKTGVEPNCWTLAHQYVTMTNEYKPMVYYSSANAHSGNYSLILNKRGIYAMPEYDGNVNTLQLSFYLRQSATKYQLQVGVMSDLSNPSTFVLVATLNNSSTTDVVQQTVDFSSYTGSGRYIAFRNILASGNTGDYSVNYIDDLVLDERPAPTCPAITAADLPYTDNFDTYTTATTAKTGVEPDCWTLAHQYVTMTDEYKPMVYYNAASAHSGNYSLILNKRGIYAMPEYDGNVNTLQLSFYLRQSATKYQLQVGVMSDLSNPSTFVPVATLNNSSTTDVVQQTVDFSSYTGSGRYIAFRNILASGNTGDYSVNYIDDLVLDERPAPTCPAITAADLPYTDNFDTYTTATTAKTGVAPDCWTLAHQYVTMTDEYKPMIYYSTSNAHSGNYSLILNKRGIYAMPEYNGSVNTLQLSFYLKQTATKYQLQVGVMSNLSNSSTFVPVATFNNSSTTASVPCTVDFSSYTGSGHYIAFKNTLASGQTGDYSCNYIDDLELSLAAPTCPAITAADLPYTDNFDTYTTATTAKTGVEPNCWTLAHQYVTMTDEYKPMVYYNAASAHSGNYSLILNKRGIYAMPEFDGSVNTLQLSFYLRQSATKYQLQVGVMSDLNNPSTFVPVATLNNSSTTDVVQHTVSFASYTGTGRYIAFKNTLASGQTGDYSCNYIDDIALSLRGPDCVAITAADLPYTDNFDGYTTSTTAKTGVEPDCWILAHQYVTMTDEYKPMVYYNAASAHSGNYSLILNKRGIYAMPEFDGSVNTLQLSFYLRQSATKYQLQVGVMSDLSNPSTFVPVATLNNSSTTDVVQHTVSFASYTGTGRYIAFKNILASGQTGDYSCNYIDDLRLETRCVIYPDELPFTDNFDTYTTSTTAKTGVEPDCWSLAHQDVTMADEYKPMVYYNAANAHSGNYSLILNKRGIYAMPEFNGSVKNLQLSFYLKQTQAKYQLQVGVMSDLNNASTFVPVATLNNSSTTASVLRTVNFSSYTGTGRYIAFRNTLASGQTGDYSCNYIDDITLAVAAASVAKGSGDEDGYTSGGHRLTLYPNPTTGKLTVEADDEVARVDVFDYTGRCVATYQGQTTLDLGHLAAGLYTLRLTLPDRIEVRRVVKQ